MIDFRSVREQRASSFDFIQVRIASPEEIRGPKDPKERERLEIERASLVDDRRTNQLPRSDPVHRRPGAWLLPQHHGAPACRFPTSVGDPGSRAAVQPRASSSAKLCSLASSISADHMSPAPASSGTRRRLTMIFTDSHPKLTTSRGARQLPAAAGLDSLRA